MHPAKEASTPIVLATGALVAGKYELLRLLGRGGVGEVWSARHCSLGQDVAIKFLVPPKELDPDDILSRFQLEARIAAHLSRRTRHIASVIDYGIAEGVAAYLVMELVDGVSLETLISRGDHRDLHFVSTIVTQLAKGLSIAHDENVIHRDLKPSNVMLTSGDEPGIPLVKILDFGIGKLDVDAFTDRRPFRGSSPALNRHTTLVGTTLGTPAYMSPEQVEAKSEIDRRCDVWALAVVAYELLSGVCPFEGNSVVDTLSRVLSRKRTPIFTHRPDLPESTRAIFDRAFAMRIEDRFPSALAFAEAIRALAEEEPAVTTRWSPPANAHDSITNAITRTPRTDAPLALDAGRPRSRHSRTRFVLVAAITMVIAAGFLPARFGRGTASPASAAHATLAVPVAHIPSAQRPLEARVEVAAPLPPPARTAIAIATKPVARKAIWTRPIVTPPPSLPPAASTTAPDDSPYQ